jgi:hypothetical protein
VKAKTGNSSQPTTSIFVGKQIEDGRTFVRLQYIQKESILHLGKQLDKVSLYVGTDCGLQCSVLDVETRMVGSIHAPLYHTIIASVMLAVIVEHENFYSTDDRPTSR